MIKGKMKKLLKEITLKNQKRKSVNVSQKLYAW